jgi:hypothetical protein
MWFGSLEVQGHTNMKSIFNKPFLETSQKINLRRITVEKHTDMITVHKNNSQRGGNIVALLKEYSHPVSPSDVWLVLLKDSRPPQIVSEAYGERSPESIVPWPGKHWQTL